MRRVLIVRVLLVLLLGCSLISAQTSETGFPPFVPQAGGLWDSVNLMNLNVHLRFPITTRRGRGPTFSFAVNYDSVLAYQRGLAGAWILNFAWDTGGGIVSLPAPGVSQSASQQISCAGGGSGSQVTYDGVVDVLGTFHPLASNITVNTCTGNGGTATTNDGSGYVASVSGSLTSTVTSREGTVFVYPGGSLSAGNPQTITDSNGNQLSFDGTTITDTLGTTPLTSSGGNNYPNPFSYSFPNAQGGNSTTKFSYANPAPAIQTAFQCGGIMEESIPAGQEVLIDTVTLPDNSTFHLAYEPTPNQPSSVTGRLGSLTGPTGGTITYQYFGPNDGINCLDGTNLNLKRITSDGTWTYSRTLASDGRTTLYTTVTDPQGNQTVVYFTGGVETERLIYQGASSGGTLLQTVFTCYNGAKPNCNSTAVNFPITEVSRFIQLPGGKRNEQDVFLDKNTGNVVEVDEYDFGSNQPGALLRKQVLAYASLGNNISNRPATVTLCAPGGSDSACNGAGTSGGTRIAQTTFGYDESTLAQTSVSQHVGVSGSRGNVTSIHRWLNTTGGTLDTINTYDDTGNVVTSTDPGGHKTSFTFSGCNGAFATQTKFPDTASPSLAHHTSSATYDCATGLPTSSTDQNGNLTKYFYDTMLRRTEVDFPGGGQTLNSYPDPNHVTVQRKIDSSRSTSSTTLLDGYGRASRVETANGEQTPYDQQDFCYDATGRLGFKSYPYQGNGFTTAQVCSGAGDSFNYDALGRPTKVTHSDQSSVVTTYGGTALKVTDEGNGTSNVSRIFQKDGLGRLNGVCEVYSGSNLLGGGGTPATCGLDIAGTGFLTSYSYDLLDDLTGVAQGTLGGRSFSYDSLSRMISETTPEAGTVTYSYNADSLLTQRMRPAPNQTDSSKTFTTNYAYDALHRQTDRSYVSSDPVNIPVNTPGAHFAYDAIPGWGNRSITGSNLSGRLAETYTDPPISGAVFGYDSMGRLTMNNQCTPFDCSNTRIQISGGTDTLKYVYNAACLSTSGATYTDSVFVKNQGSAPVRIGGQIADGPVIQPGTAQQVSFSYTGNGVLCSQLRFETLNVGDSIDVIATNPSVTVNGGGNLIPAANQNFSGWGTYGGSSVTLTQNGNAPADRAISYTYDLAGDMTSSGNGAGVIFNYSYNIAQRLTQMTSSLSDANHPGTLLSGAQYSPSAVTDTLGNGVIETTNFSPRGFVQSYNVSGPTGVPGSGSVVVSGSLHTYQQQTQAAAYASGSVAISGTETCQFAGGFYGGTPWECGGGTVAISVNGVTDTYSYCLPNGGFILVYWPPYNVPNCDTPNTIASGLTTAINADSSQPVTASANGSTVTLTAKTIGSLGNGYSLSVSVTEYLLSPPPFSAAASGSSLTGGQDAVYQTLYDNGTTTIEANGHTDTYSWSGSGTTAGSIAQGLCNGINADTGAVVSASTNGVSGQCPLGSATVSLLAKQGGATSDYSLSGTSSNSVVNSFSTSCPGFSSCSGATLTGGEAAAYSYSLGRASDGQITSANDFVNGNWSFAYDPLNRLASSNKNSGQQTFSYLDDRYGNRWQQNAPQGGPSAQQTFDNNNHIQTGISGLTYDALGNVTNDGFHNYAYDAENRMIKVDGGATAIYVYDAFGRRVEGPNGDYLYDSSGNMITLIGLNGVWNFGEIYAAGRHVATYSGGTTNFMHGDWLGTKRVITAANGTVSETCTGFIFGDGVNCNGTNWSFNGFTDDLHDPESNLEHTLFRQYSSSEGRWLTADPAGLASADPSNPQSWNRYAYVMGDPANSSDPTGLDPWWSYGGFGVGLCSWSGWDCDFLGGAPWGLGNIGGNLGSLASAPLNFGCGTSLLPGNPCTPFGSLADQIRALLAGLPWNNPCIMSPISDGCGIDSLQTPSVPFVAPPKLFLSDDPCIGEKQIQATISSLGNTDYYAREVLSSTWEGVKTGAAVGCAAGAMVGTGLADWEHLKFLEEAGAAAGCIGGAAFLAIEGGAIGYVGGSLVTAPFWVKDQLSIYGNYQRAKNACVVKNSTGMDRL